MAASRQSSGCVDARRALFALFTLSGFAGLIYESIWSHYLRLFLGHASYAQILVLVIFMGGMAIGSALASRYSPRWRNLLLVYAIAEVVVGIFGIAFHSVFDRGTAFAYAAVFPMLESPLSIQAVKWTFAALMISSQSVLLGMTFPLVSGAMIRRFPHSVGHSIATLYFTNSLGAAVGVLVSGFLLISWVGLPGTIMSAGFLSILLGLIVWLMCRDPRWRQDRLASTSREPRFGPQMGLAAPLLTVALITGTASFMYEIAWIRMLVHVLGSSTHAFELILSAFIFGIACGSFWVRRRIEQWRDPISSLGLIQVVMGVLALATLLTYNQSFDVMSFTLRTLKATPEGYGAFNIVSHAIAFCVMLPATFCAGMTLPLVTHTLIGVGYGEKSIGAVYAANTVGAIGGIILAVQLAMPAVGLKGLIVIGAGLDIGLGIYILLRVVKAPAFGRVLWSGSVGAIAVLATALFVQLDPESTASAVYQRGTARALPGVEFPFHRDGKTATVDLLVYPIGITAIATNGKTDATINMVNGAPFTSDEVTMVLLGAIPLAARPNAESAAVIGFGSGLTTHVLLGSKKLETVDTIEIESAMVEASRIFRPRVERAYSDPRSRIHIEDARTFFSAYGKRYDIIISEPSHPWVSGVSNLYSTQFYALVKRHLTESGVFAQWLHLTKNDPVLVASVIGALSGQFQSFNVYNTNERDILVLASVDGDLKLDFQSVFESPELALDLRRVGVKLEQDISARRLGNAHTLGSYYRSFTASRNSDYFPVLDLNAFRAQYLGTSATELFFLRAGPLPVMDMLETHTSPNTTMVSPGSPVERLRSIHTATLLRDYLVGDVKAAPGQVPDNIREIGALTEMLLRDCSAAQDYELAITHLNTVADYLIAFLQPSELEQVWREIESAACVEGWPLKLRWWFSLIKAESARDAPGMLKYSTQLLDSGEGATNDARKEYLVAVGMLAHLSSGDKRGAMATWSRFGSPSMATGELSTVLRFLVAYGGS